SAPAGLLLKSTTRRSSKILGVSIDLSFGSRCAYSGRGIGGRAVRAAPFLCHTLQTRGEAVGLLEKCGPTVQSSGRELRICFAAPHPTAPLPKPHGVTVRV